MNFGVTFGLFPKEWKTGKLIIFSKGSDEDLTRSGSYRPICLLSVLVKILESRMAKRLKILIQPQLDDTQFCFRKERPTEDAIYMFKQIIKDALAILLDIKNAFKTVW